MFSPEHEIRVDFHAAPDPEKLPHKKRKKSRFDGLFKTQKN